MSKIIQFSTIGALMASHLQGEHCLRGINNNDAFGLGCSELINGELTIFQGKAWEATANESVHLLNRQDLLPFFQITEFHPEIVFRVKNINFENANKLLAEKININNIFLAISIEAKFKEVTIRRPQRSNKKDRTSTEVAESQYVNSFQDIQGRLIGFWTPELYGRISVPGFHFHFINEEKNISGHVLGFKAEDAIMSFEEKQTLEITNPTSDQYKELKIDLSKLDGLINRIEK